MEKKLKVLNLYAGIGGNRKLWKDVDVTAVEINPQIAKIYQDNFPDDKVIIVDGHQYLLEHFKEFDFIWSSPPCPSHSRMRLLWKGDPTKVNGRITGQSYKYPDMSLWQEILFLNHFFDGKFVVENVISYYKSLDLHIPPQECESHYFWSNITITPRKRAIRNLKRDSDVSLEKWDFDLKGYDLPKRFRNNLLNNMVSPKLALHIFNCAYKSKQILLNEVETNSSHH